MKVYILLLLILSLITFTKSLDKEITIGLPKVKDEKGHHDFIYCKHRLILVHPQNDSHNSILKKRNLDTSNSSNSSSNDSKKDIIRIPVDARYISDLSQDQINDYYVNIIFKEDMVTI